KYYIEIINITGQIVIERREIISNENIDISHLANGTYLVLIESDGKKIPKLFMVNR
ncbi:MAG: T9SS type A sorting domain-containing protein, partial [Candidatus Kapabacteria bacterium]|nr:T9SS type A sorting domain-containing protein [Candidatus Kapabacteria bacterium]